MTSFQSLSLCFLLLYFVLEHLQLFLLDTDNVITLLEHNLAQLVIVLLFRNRADIRCADHELFGRLQYHSIVPLGHVVLLFVRVYSRLNCLRKQRFHFAQVERFTPADRTLFGCVGHHQLVQLSFSHRRLFICQQRIESFVLNRFCAFDFGQLFQFWL